MLEIQLFGPATISVDGDPIEVDTRKAIALLAYLVVQGEVQSRERLAGLLWPEYDQERARAALRRTLSALKRALGGRWLEADRSQVRMSRDQVICDVWRLQELIESIADHPHEPEQACGRCIEALLEATSLASRGDLLSGFVLKDSAEFEDWLYLSAQTSRQGFSRALERLVELLVAAGDLERALEKARGWIAIDALHEPAHRTLMRLQAWTGNRNAALEHYRDCIALFDRELGVTPLQETTELYEAIREDRLGPRPVATARSALGPRPEMQPAARFPLVGRADDFETLWQAYSSATTSPRLLLVEGEAGIGKTALATEFAERVETGGGRVVSVRAYEEEQDIAYSPVAQALRAGVESGGELGGVPVQWRSEAARLVPGIDAPRGEPHNDPGAQARFLEGVARCLAAACTSDPPGLLFLDDAQWADVSTLEVLAFLLRRVEAGVCLLVSFRSGEIAPGHLLRRLLVESAPDPRGVHVTLGRLEPADVTQLVQSVAPAVSAADPTLVERLYQETEGVPYFIVEYLASMKDGAEPDWDVPPTVRELVLARVRACSALAGQVLAAAAVAGRSFDFDGLRAASGRSDEETVSALEELSDRLLVTEVPTDAAVPTYDFVHEKVREVVYAETSLARRRILHGRIADALMKTRPEVPGVIAQHLLAAGREPEAALAFEEAGRQAASLYANAEAREHFMTALGLRHPDDASLHEAVGDLDTLAGAYGDALARYETAAALGDGSRIPEIERKLAEVHVRLGDYSAADSHLEAALDMLDPHDHQLARILADRSLLSERIGNESRARSLADDALLEAERSGDTGALAQAHNILGILDKRSGKVEDSVAHLERSLEIARSGGDETARAAALNNLALATGAGGDNDRALELAAQALELCTRLGDRHREAALHSNVADLLHRKGRGEEAMAHLKQGAAILAEVGEPGVMHPEVWKLTEW